jgi:hypothetical protein
MAGNHSTPEAHIVNAVNAHRAAPWSVIRTTMGQLIALTAILLTG